MESRKFFKRTKRGRVVTVVREHYLRDDLDARALASPASREHFGLAPLEQQEATPTSRPGSAKKTGKKRARTTHFSIQQGVEGAADVAVPLPKPEQVEPAAAECEQVLPEAGGHCLSRLPRLGCYWVIDTNIALHQMDLLEFVGQDGQPVLTDLIVPQTVLEEVQHRSRPMAARLRTLLTQQGRRTVLWPNQHVRATYTRRRTGETPNDHADRSIRAVAAYYGRLCAASGVRVVLVSDDAAMRQKAVADGIPVTSGALLASAVAGALGASCAGIVDKAAGGGVSDAAWTTEATPAQRATWPAEHLSEWQLQEGVKSGALHRGTLRADKQDWRLGSVLVRMPASSLQRLRAEVGRHADTGAAATAAATTAPGAASAVVDDPAWVDASELQALAAGASGQAMQMVAVHCHGTERLNRAMDGDAVAVQIDPKASDPNGTLVGTVVGIFRRGWRLYCGTLVSESGDEEAVAAAATGGAALSSRLAADATMAAECVCKPVDGRFPPIRLRTRQRQQLTGQRIVVAVDRWPRGSSLPVGHLVRALGRVGDRSTETAVVLMEHEIPSSDFSAAVMACLPRRDWTAETDPDFQTSLRLQRRRAAAAGKPNTELAASAAGGDEDEEGDVDMASSAAGAVGPQAGLTSALALSSGNVRAVGGRVRPPRLDLRGISVCSIDPPGCRDIDDALHARLVVLPPVQVSEATDHLWDDVVSAGGVPNGSQGAGASLGAGGVPVLEVGVHIADVTHFVADGCAMDAEAANRGNTTYLVGKRLDMLPKLLTESLCSLKGNVDRFAFSALWRLRPKQRARRQGQQPVEGVDIRDYSETLQLDVSALSGGSVLDYSKLPAAWRAPELEWELVGAPMFAKSVVHSRSAMQYADAQGMMDAAAEALDRTPRPKLEAGTASRERTLASSVCALAVVARWLRVERLRRGALTLASPEMRFQFNESHDPIDVASYQSREANKLVEEMMLFANIAVAERILESFSDSSVLRRHPPPTEEQFGPLVAAADSVGVRMNVRSGKEVAASLQGARASFEAWASAQSGEQALPDAATFDKLLRILTTRCMMQAKYFASRDFRREAYAHYGLASEVYTHFTSPIRRYADVMVHRLLAAALGYMALPKRISERRELSRLTANLNRRNYNSQLAGRSSGQITMAELFRGRSEVVDGFVIRVSEREVGVIALGYGLERAVPLTAERDALQSRLLGQLLRKRVAKQAPSAGEGERAPRGAGGPRRSKRGRRAGGGSGELTDEELWGHLGLSSAGTGGGVRVAGVDDASTLRRRLAGESTRPGGRPFVAPLQVAVDPSGVAVTVNGHVVRVFQRVKLLLRVEPTVAVARKLAGGGQTPAREGEEEEEQDDLSYVGDTGLVVRVIDPPISGQPQLKA